MKNILFVVLILISINIHAQTLTPITFHAKGDCEMCKERIEEAAKKAGAKNVHYDLSKQLVSAKIDAQKTTLDAVEKSVADAGHDTEKFKAPDEVYSKLPDCCHYIRDNKFSKAPNLLRGLILEENINGKMTPIPNVTIKDVANNFSIQTNEKGGFEIPYEKPTFFSLSHISFNKDSVPVNSTEFLTILLQHKANNKLEVVTVTGTRNRYLSSTSINNQLNLGVKELTKAACCNLSESFETSPSVDVSYSDAVTGIKQIQLLGLSGSYTQTITENTPEFRGISSNMGFSFIPGPWIENIQVTKGIGSVINGYESIAGQINVELKKPNQKSPLFVNGYINQMGRLEGNIVSSTKINDKWSTATLLHGNGVLLKNDMNNDGFLDIPKGHQLNIANRWEYVNGKGLNIHWILKAVSDRRIGGESDFTKADKLTTKSYGVLLDNDAFNGTAKIGYIFPEKKHQSIGLILSGNYSKINNIFGLTNYKAKQSGFYGNLIYQSIIGNDNHKFKTGISFVHDNTSENVFAKQYNRNENVPGGFFEYTFTATPQLSFVAGIREDYHNDYGWITTPRLHVKFDATDNTIFRLAAGTGFRVANIFADNTNAFISARKFIIDPSGKTDYGLAPEKAINYGISFMQKFKTHNKESHFTIDAYRTTFKQQTVVDYDQNPQEIHFYDLDGQSFSNTIMTELNLNVLKNLAARMAYRYLDVQTDYKKGRMQKPLQSQHRAFINLAYELNNGWSIDYTTQWLSKKRIPFTGSNPQNLQMNAYSPSYFQMSAQVTKKLNNGLELYLGGENLTNYRQKHLFIDEKNPFGQHFDGSLVWGPALGAMAYFGFRYNL
ncbi:MAG: TonB-dependent receptor [Chitinophagaceae bacterium]|nr:MAG: TonB-dependent receptor [Chitinophagaceae bacterium]